VSHLKDQKHLKQQRLASPLEEVRIDDSFHGDPKGLLVTAFASTRGRFEYAPNSPNEGK
jgi:hypothetical protein